MKIAVVGAGGVGGYFGARLAAAGNEVCFVVRGRQKAAMAQGGLRILSPLGDLHLPDPTVIDGQLAPRPQDAVLVCTKLWSLPEALKQIAPLLSEKTGVVPLQNGVDAEGMAIDALGARKVLGGVAYIASEIKEPGVIHHRGKLARLSLGALDADMAPQLDALVAACQHAGIDVKQSKNIQKDIWTKFIMLTALSGATAYFRSSIGPILADAAGLKMHAALVYETAAVARAEGVVLSDDSEERTIAQTRALPGEMKSSMLVDLERGNPLELPWLSGAVVRRGAAVGVSAPEHQKVVDRLANAVKGAAPSQSL